MPSTTQDICDRLTSLEVSHSDQRDTLDAINQSTREIIEFFNAFKGAFKTLEMLAKLARPVGYIALGVSAVIGASAAVKGIFIR